MCILPLNIANEKIFFAFWLLFMLLFSVSILAIVNRIVTLSLPWRRKRAIRKLIKMGRFREASRRSIEDFLDKEILELTAIGDWYMLLQVGENVDGHYFNYFVVELSNALEKGWRYRSGLPELDEVSTDDDETRPLSSHEKA